MEFNNIVIIIALILLIICLVIYAVSYNKISSKAFPYTQDECPKLWMKDDEGNCLNPICSGDSINCNSLAPGGTWASTSKTPGYDSAIQPAGGFNPNHSKWDSYKSAKSAICGKKAWSNENKIEWNGVSTYNSC